MYYSTGTSVVRRSFTGVLCTNLPYNAVPLCAVGCTNFLGSVTSASLPPNLVRCKSTIPSSPNRTLKRQPKRILVVGSSLAGLSLALGLRKNGIQADLIDPAASLDPVEYGRVCILPSSTVGILKNQMELESKLTRDSFGVQLDQFRMSKEDGRLRGRIEYQKMESAFGNPTFSVQYPVLHNLLSVTLSKPSKTIPGLRIARSVRVSRVETIEKGPNKGKTQVRFIGRQTGVYDAVIIATQDIPDPLQEEIVRFPDVKRKKDIQQRRNMEYGAYSLLVPRPAALPPNTAAQCWGFACILNLTPISLNQICLTGIMTPVEGKIAAQLFEDTLNTVSKFPSRFQQDFESAFDAGPLIENAKDEADGNQYTYTVFPDLIEAKRRTFGNISLLGPAACHLGHFSHQAALEIEDGYVLSKHISELSSVEEALKKYDQERTARTAPLVKKAWKRCKLALHPGWVGAVRRLAVMPLTFNSSAITRVEKKFNRSAPN